MVTKRSISRRIFRIFLWITSSMLVIVALLVGFIISPPGKRMVRSQLLSFLRGKLHTEVQLGEIQYELPKMVGFRGLLLKDQARDTMLFAGSLKIDIDLLQLLRKRVSVNDLVLEDVVMHAYRNKPDTDFNFSYAIQAFTGAPDTATKDSESGSAFRFDVGSVKLNRIRLAFEDGTGGMYVHTKWDKLEVAVKELVPDKMIFRLKSIELTGFEGSILRDASMISPSPDTAQSIMPTLALQELHLRQTQFRYADKQAGTDFHTQLSSLDLLSDTIDLDRQKIVLKSISGTSGNTSMQFRSSEGVDTTLSKPWHVSVANIDLDDFAFQMDDLTKPKLPRGMDYAHLALQRINIKTGRLQYSPDIISADIREVSLYERSGLQLQQFQTQFYYTDTGLGIHNLFLKTPKSEIHADALISYRTPEDFQKRLGQLPVSLRLKDCSLNYSDVRLFAPQLDTMRSLQSFKSSPLFVDAELRGAVGDLAINRLRMLAGTNTLLSATGRISGLPESDKVRYSLVLAPLRSSRKDLLPLVPEKAQAQFRLPDYFSISGRISGAALDYFPDLLVRSSDGAARLTGKLRMSAGEGRELYQLNVQTHSLNLGRLLRKDTLVGAISATLSVEGIGLDPKKMSTHIEAAIQSAYVKGYAYRDVKMQGQLADQMGHFNLVSIDPNVHLKMSADADFSREFMALYAKVAIDSFDALATGFSAEPLKLKADLDISAPTLNPDYPEVSLHILNPSVATAGEVYVGDSLSVISKPNADSGQHIEASLDFLKLEVFGKTPLRSIVPAIKEHVSRHYRLSDSAEGLSVVAPPVPDKYGLQVKASVFRSPLLSSFVPKLRQLDTVTMQANLNESALQLTVNAALADYNGQRFKGLEVSVDERDTSFTYGVMLERFTGSNIQLFHTELNGTVESNSISARLSTRDQEQKERFRIGANFMSSSGRQILSLHPEMLLDYKNWTTAQPNQLVIQPEGVYAQNVLLRGGGAEISIHSAQPDPLSPMDIRVSKFEISDLTRLLSGDTALASGLLEGTATLKSLKPAPLFDANFSVRQLALNGDTIGDLSLNAANDQQQTVATVVKLSGNGNELTLSGNYYSVPVEGNDLDMNLHIQSMNLRSMEGLAMGQIKESSGGLTSKLRVYGKFTAPLLDGSIQTQDLKTRVSALNAVFKMPAETIHFKGQQLQFERFRILDSTGNTATIDGDILFSNMQQPTANLVLDARNWRALSATRGANSFAYGNLVLSTHLLVKGPMRQPSLNGSLTVEKGTNLSILLPESGTEYEDYTGIVVFRDSRHPEPLKSLQLPDTIKGPALLAGSDINVNLLTNEEAEFNVIVDQATGDFLNVRGKAQINTSMDRGGSLTMNGVYEISGGAYQLNYNLIRRKFDISKGSTITFAGDPLDADMNITAVYKANVPPYDLVERQVPDPSQLVYYRQALPFQVELKMNGPVMTPQLGFDIVLPENQTYRLSSDAIQLVQAKLSQLRIDTSELNKQVFALLILKRFITDDPFSSGTGTSAEFAAKQSVSRFIGEQLNQLAGQLINGLDLSVDLAASEDYTSGTRRERTDLSIAASKRLLNDRLKVTIGNNFELEGPQTKSNNSNSSLIPGNLAVDYSLSSDNRYSIRAYRQSLDQGVIQGFVTETGLNFIVNYDYNRFRNLFISRRKLLQRRQQRPIPSSPLIQKK